MHEENAILEKPERYGKLIQPEEAKESLFQEILDNDREETGEIFLKAFEKYVNSKTAIAIKYSDENKLGFIHSYNIIAKSKEDENIEITFFAGKSLFLPGIFSTDYSLKIGLKYDGKDTEFQPKIPEKSCIKRFIYKVINWNNWVPQPEDYFPLLNKKYKGLIIPVDKIEDPDLSIEVNDKRLEQIAKDIYRDIKFHKFV